MFHMEDIEHGINAAHDDLDDLEVDHDYLSRFVPTLLRPNTPIGAAVSMLADLSQLPTSRTKPNIFISPLHLPSNAPVPFAARKKCRLFYNII